MMKNDFYFILKVLFILKIEKRFDLEDKVTLEIDAVTAWLTNNYNTHIAQYLPN